MDFDRLQLTATITEDLLALLRARDPLVDGETRAHATYDTTFFGRYRIEVGLGRECLVAVEQAGGDAAFDWTQAEADRRRPSPRMRSTPLESTESTVPGPSLYDVTYRAETFAVDPSNGRRLFESLQALDWGEPTPAGRSGRDGIVVHGSLTTEVGVRTWTSWSPDPTSEPAKHHFFDQILRFATTHAPAPLSDDLARLTI